VRYCAGADRPRRYNMLGEVLHVYRDHVKKALALALLSGKF
jgi:hypothetical protein